MLTLTDAQKKATNKFLKANYTQINIRVRSARGEHYKRYFKDHPEMKMNKYIEKCLDDLTGYTDSQDRSGTT